MSYFVTAFAPVDLILTKKIFNNVKIKKREGKMHFIHVEKPLYFEVEKGALEFLFGDL